MNVTSITKINKKRKTIRFMASSLGTLNQQALGKTRNLYFCEGKKRVWAWPGLGTNDPHILQEFAWPSHSPSWPQTFTKLPLCASTPFV